MKDELLALLSRYGQQHLLNSWEQLEPSQRDQLASEIRQVDLDLITSLFRETHEAAAEVDWRELSVQAEPPPAVRLAAGDGKPLFSAGEQALRAGRVGMILVAGGQGTRLRFPHPKGMFPVGPISGRTLFQVLIDRLRAVGQRYGVQIPLFVMTSPATHTEVADYFAQHDRCGLAKADLEIFCQGVMPAVDAETGRLLRKSPSSLSLSPDGHGGMLAAFARSGCLEKARGRNIDLLFYGQIDNPLLQVCDPGLLGCHLTSESEMTTQVVRKQEAAEKMGNVVQIDGRVRIIEYSDLPPDVADQRNPDGSLRLWAGNLAVHIFDRAFLERMASEADRLPFHQARKVTAFVDDAGELVQPSQPNSIKFEKFIFDLLPAARRAAVVESAKADAFAPVKNADGAPHDTPHTARQAMIARDRKLLELAGVEVAADIPVEVNPLWALDAADVSHQLKPGTTIASATYFPAAG